MSETEPSAPRPGPPSLGGVRYRLSVLLQEAARELRNPALALEQLAQLEAVVAAQLLPKDQACKWWADGLGLAYVDVAASVVTDEAVALIPLEIAQKLKAIGLYVVEDVLTVALAQPGDPRIESPRRGTVHRRGRDGRAWPKPRSATT